MTTAANNNATTIKTYPVNKHDIIKSIQKDEYYKNKLKSLLKDALAAFTNNNPALNDEQTMYIISNLIYYHATTLCSKQTIGQECYNVVLLSRLGSQKLGRAVYILIKIVNPYIINKLAQLKQNRNLFIYFAQKLLYFADKYRNILFLLGVSNFYGLNSYLSRMLHISITGNADRNRSVYSRLGYLEILIFLINLVNETWRCLKAHQRREANEESSRKSTTDSNAAANKPSLKTNCSLCLGSIEGVTATKCGHLFCWSCINRFVESNYSDSDLIACPICKSITNRKDLTFIFNYSDRI